MEDKKTKSLNRKKGALFQKWCEKWLIERGFIVRNFMPTAKAVFIPKLNRTLWISQDNDCFASDLVARKDGKVYWIQVSHGTAVTKRIEDFKKYFIFLLPGEELMLWLKRPKGYLQDVGSYVSIYVIDKVSFEAVEEARIIRRELMFREGATEITMKLFE